MNDWLIDANGDMKMKMNIGIGSESEVVLKTKFGKKNQKIRMSQLDACAKIWTDEWKREWEWSEVKGEVRKWSEYDELCKWWWEKVWQ